MDAKAKKAIDLEPLFLVGDADLTRISLSRSRHNNSLAKECGQEEKVCPSELIDLYYSQKGRCSWCTCGLTISNIQLDHIIESQYRSTRAAALRGDVRQGGKIASIENMQWLCRACNSFKELCKRNGLDMPEYAERMLEQSRLEFPLRKYCDHMGSKGGRSFRASLINECLRDRRSISASEMCKMLAGTPGEASYATVLQHMKELGWEQHKKRSWREDRIEIIKKVADENGLLWASKSELLNELNSRILPERGKGFSWIAWAPEIASCGIVFSFTGSSRKAFARTSVCAGDKAAVMSVIKTAGSCGISVEDIKKQSEQRGVPPNLIEEAIECLASEFAIYSRDNNASFVASLDRKQAAKIIGVSWLRLKKWACAEWDGKHAGPPYMKCGNKGLTYYRHEDVIAFVQMRIPHSLDLVAAGRREACVEGGRLGGRPKQAVKSLFMA